MQVSLTVREIGAVSETRGAPIQIKYHSPEVIHCIRSLRPHERRHALPKVKINGFLKFFHFFTCTGHPIFCFNLIFGRLVSGKIHGGNNDLGAHFRSKEEEGEVSSEDGEVGRRSPSV